MKQAAIKSWKTTALGVMAALGAALTAAAAYFDADPSTVPDVDGLITTGTLALALIMARDNDVSSKSAGAE